MPRSAKHDSALKSTPEPGAHREPLLCQHAIARAAAAAARDAPSARENTMDVLYAAAGLVLLGGTGSRDSAMKRLCGREEPRACGEQQQRACGRARAVMCGAGTRVKLSWSSWMLVSSATSPYSSPARELATAAQSLRCTAAWGEAERQDAR
jgi:hypothetical protein